MLITKTKKEVNPITDRELYARAERAAFDAFVAANVSGASRRHRMKLMDEAAIAVFKIAGASRKVAEFYATVITDVAHRN